MVIISLSLMGFRLSTDCLCCIRYMSLCMYFVLQVLSTQMPPKRKILYMILQKTRYIKKKCKKNYLHGNVINSKFDIAIKLNIATSICGYNDERIIIITVTAVHWIVSQKVYIENRQLKLREAEYFQLVIIIISFQIKTFLFLPFLGLCL